MLLSKLVQFPTLYYADRVYQINLAVAGIAVGTVMLPELSKFMLNNNSSGQIADLQNRAIGTSAYFYLYQPLLHLVLASEEVVTSLFGYGSFNNVIVLLILLLHLPFLLLVFLHFAILKILFKFLFCQKRYQDAILPISCIGNFKHNN